MGALKSKLLSQTKINKWKNDPESKGSIFDGEGLYLVKYKQQCSYVLRYKYRRADGTNDTKQTIGDESIMTLDEAREKAYNLRKLAKQGIHLKTYQDREGIKGKSFGEVLGFYFKDKKSSLKPSSSQKLKTVLRHIYHWNGVIMEKINHDDINEVIRKVKNKSPSVAAYLLREIKSIFKYAHEEHYIRQIPQITIKAHYKIKEREHYLKEEQLGTFFKCLWQDDDVSYQIKVAIYSLFILMLRRNELLTLKWSDVDLKVGKVTVPQTKKIKNFMIKMPQCLVDKWQELKCLANESVYIFNGRNTHLNVKTLYLYCKKLGDKYGVGSFSPHDARRTAMTLLSDHGQPYKVIDTALGHIQTGVNKSYMKTHLGEPRAKLLEYWSQLINELSA